MLRLTTARPREAEAEAESSADLVGRAQRGDAEAFDRLYAAHAERVYALCLRTSADAVRARELTQDVFVRVWQKLGGFRGESQFSTWLHRLAANVVLESLRAEHRGSRRLEVVMPDEVLAATPGPSGSTEGEGLDLEAAIAALPAGARTMLVLHAIEGYRYEEIAEMTGVSLGTVKAQIHRARRLLREALER